MNFKFLFGVDLVGFVEAVGIQIQFVTCLSSIIVTQSSNDSIYLDNIIKLCEKVLPKPIGNVL